MAEEKKIENMLVPVRHPDDVNRVTELASVLADGSTIVYLTVIKQGNFLEMQQDWRKSSDVLEKDRSRTFARRAEVIPKIRYSDTVWEGVLDQADEEDSDLIVLGWGGKISLRSLRQKTPVEKIFTQSKRDVLAFKSKDGGVRNIEKILFPVGYKDYDYKKRLSITARIVKNTGAECVLFHVKRENETEKDVKEVFEGPKTFMEELGIDCKTKSVENVDILEALLEESEKHDLMILGPTREYIFSRYLFGWMTDEIVNNAKCSTIVFKEGEHKIKAWIMGVISGFINEVKKFFGH